MPFLNAAPWVAFNKSVLRPKVAELPWGLEVGLWETRAMTDRTHACT